MTSQSVCFSDSSSLDVVLCLLLHFFEFTCINLLRLLLYNFFSFLQRVYFLDRVKCFSVTRRVNYYCRGTSFLYFIHDLAALTLQSETKMMVHSLLTLNQEADDNGGKWKVVRLRRRRLTHKKDRQACHLVCKKNSHEEVRGKRMIWPRI